MVYTLNLFVNISSKLSPYLENDKLIIKIYSNNIHL